LRHTERTSWVVKSRGEAAFAGAKKPPISDLSGLLSACRTVVFRGLFIRIGGRHFRQTAISGEARGSVDLLIGHFRTRIHEGPLMKMYRTEPAFSTTISDF
jgi:hypothetical protein